jgi:hypothetical protein
VVYVRRILCRFGADGRYVGLLDFGSALTSISTPVLLYSAQSRPLSILLMEYSFTGELERAAALGLLITIDFSHDVVGKKARLATDSILKGSKGVSALLNEMKSCWALAENHKGREGPGSHQNKPLAQRANGGNESCLKLSSFSYFCRFGGGTRSKMIGTRSLPRRRRGQGRQLVPRPVMRNAVIPKFTARFGIPVEFIAGRSSQIVSRLQTERAAGIYSVDAFLAGPDTTALTLRREIIDPLKPLR